jgi:hypothetical protein
VASGEAAPPEVARSATARARAATSIRSRDTTPILLQREPD